MATTRGNEPAKKQRKPSGKPSNTNPPKPKPPAKRRYYSPIGSKKYRISQRYGNPSSRYKSGKHQGVDFAVPLGTAIVSVVGGTVIFVGDAGAHGLRVGVRGDDGRVYYYGHLSKFAVQKGQRVEGGALLAYSGNTGQSTGPHMHLQVEENGRPIDPSYAVGSDVAYKGYESSSVGGSVAGQRTAQTAALQRAKYNFPFDVSKYLDQGLRSGLTGGELEDYVYALILQGPEFAKAYPGIKRPDGTLIVSPADYTSLREEYFGIAQEHGLDLNNTNVGGLIQRGVSPDEFKSRARAIQNVRSNPQVFKELNNQIADLNAQRAKMGLPPLKQIVSLKDAVDFASGQASKDVYAVYESAEIRASAVGSGLNLSSAEARDLASRTPGMLDPDEIDARFVRVARQLREGEVDLRQFGLTQNDLLTLEFGGKNRGLIATAAEQALVQAQAKAGAQQAVQVSSIDESGRPVVAERREASL